MENRNGPVVRLASLLLALLAACSGSPTGSVGTPGTNACGETTTDPQCHTLSFGGIERAYLLHVPSNFQAGSSALVIALHGSQGSGLRLSQTSGLSQEADKEGFAVVYPYALVSPGAGFTEWNEFFNHSFGTSARMTSVSFVSSL